MRTNVVLGCLSRIALYSTVMDIDSFKQKIKIAGVQEILGLSRGELAGQAGARERTLFPAPCPDRGDG